MICERTWNRTPSRVYLPNCRAVSLGEAVMTCDEGNHKCTLLQRNDNRLGLELQLEVNVVHMFIYVS